MPTSLRVRTLLTLGAVIALAAVPACQAGEDDLTSQRPEDPPAVVSPAPAEPGGAPSVADGVGTDASIESAARTLLAAEVGGGAFNLRSAEKVQWSDASLGCPEDGAAYAQVITPGHRLVFDRDGTLYSVHSKGYSAYCTSLVGSVTGRSPLSATL